MTTKTCNVQRGCLSKKTAETTTFYSGFRDPDSKNKLCPDNNYSERPRSLFLSLGVPSRPSPGPNLARPGPDSPCALFYSVSDPSRSRGGGHLGPSWSRPAPDRSFQHRTWTARNGLLRHFRTIKIGQKLGPDNTVVAEIITELICFEPDTCICNGN